MQMRFTVDLTPSISQATPIVALSSSKLGITLHITRPNEGMRTIPLSSELQSSISAKLQLFAVDLISMLLCTSPGLVTPEEKNPADYAIPA